MNLRIFIFSKLHDQLKNDNYTIEVRTVRKDTSIQNKYDLWKTFMLDATSDEKVQAQMERLGTDNYFSAFDFLHKDLEQRNMALSQIFNNKNDI